MNGMMNSISHIYIYHFHYSILVGFHLSPTLLCGIAAPSASWGAPKVPKASRPPRRSFVDSGEEQDKRAAEWAVSMILTCNTVCNPSNHMILWYLYICNIIYVYSYIYIFIQNNPLNFLWKFLAPRWSKHVKKIIFQYRISCILWMSEAHQAWAQRFYRDPCCFLALCANGCGLQFLGQCT